MARLLIIAPLAAFLAINLFFGWVAAVRPLLSIVHLVYDVNTRVFSLVFIAVGCTLLAARGDRARRHRAAAGLVVFGALLGGARIYATHVEPHWLDLREEVLAVPGLARPIRILHLSDIQSDAVGVWEGKVLAAARALDPDLIVNTGDLLHPIPPATIASELPKLTALIERLDPPLGKFTVDGDTDYWVRREDPEVVAGMRRLASEEVVLDIGPGEPAGGSTVPVAPRRDPGAGTRHAAALRAAPRETRAGQSGSAPPDRWNEAARPDQPATSPSGADPAGVSGLASPALEAQVQRIRILGLTLDHSASPDAARLKVGRWLRGVDPEDFVIVAGHRPDFAMGLQSLPVDLVLAGHTHGGQIRVPFYGPIVTLSKVPREWARGFRRIGTPWLDVSAGIGAEHTGGMPSIRVNCRPELVLITLAPP